MKTRLEGKNEIEPTKSFSFIKMDTSTKDVILKQI